MAQSDFYQYGENGHVEYVWSTKNFQEKITQFSFQATRTEERGLQKLAHVLNELLCDLKSAEEAKEHLVTLYKMIGFTRDVVKGKGEYMLAYMMICVWYQHFPTLGEFALKCMVELGPNEHPYGSWKDIKYFCRYCRDHFLNSESLQAYAISLLNGRLRADYTALLSGKLDSISLAAKWCPREKSSFGWMYEECATSYHADIMSTANINSREKALLKCKTEYRKMLSTLNRHLDTLQIKQCEKTWAKIDFNHVTSVSLTKQRRAFLNVDIKGIPRYPEDEDRNACAEHFSHFVRLSDKEMKGKRVSMADFTKQALEMIKFESSCLEKDILNSQWRDSASENGPLSNMIAMVDVSGSMEGDPMHAAIALGIRIAEKSVVGNRVLTFSATPSWVNLDDCPDFVSKVEKLDKADFGLHTNFAAALDLILNAIINNKMAPADVQDMVLVILSDMQIDKGDRCNKSTLYDDMVKKYREAGIQVHGVPYKPPHILFWNLRSTSGFPSLSSEPNTSMMSGFSPSLLNVFCTDGITALQGCTPWSLLQKSLNEERFKILETKAQEYFA